MKFRMADCILEWQPRRFIRGIKAVSFEEYNLKLPFGDEPHLPESLLMESLFQLGNWLIILSSDFSRMGLLVRVQQVEFIGRLHPGQTLKMEVQVKSYRDDGVLFDGIARSGSRLIARGTGCLATTAPLEEFCNSGDLRVLFGEIYRPGAGGEGF